MKNNRVLFISHVPKATGDRPVGGAGRVLLDLCGSLPGYGWTCSVVCPGRGRFVDQLNALGVPVEIYAYLQPSVKNPIATIVNIWRWIRIILRERPSIIHANAESSARTVSFAAFLLRVPVVCHVHLYWESGEVKWAFFGLPVPKAFLFVSNEQHEKNWRKPGRRLDRVRHYVLPNAVDCNIDVAPAPAAPPFRIGIIANITPQKRHEDFLAVAGILSDKGFDCEFWIVGGDPLGKEYQHFLKESTVSLGIADKVRFLGYIQDTTSIMQELHVMALTSEAESFGLVVAEGMAAGRPVVATRVGGVPEIIEDEKSGFLVDVGDVAGMADRIARLLESKSLWESIARNARKRVEENFTTSIQAQRLVAIYEDIISI